MLRAVLGLALLVFVAGIAYYVGRESGRESAPVRSAASGSQPAAAVEDQARARTESNKELHPAPQLPPQAELESPDLPHSVPGQPQGDSAALATRAFGLPIANLKPSDIHDTYLQVRGGGERRHEATDIMAPRGTPVVAVDTGVIAKLFTSKPGGLTVYQFDGSQRYAYYYAHLDRYAEGIREGQLLKKGDLVGYVGITGNSDPNAPHLHFAIFELGPEKRWWEGKPINPYPFLMKAVGK
jgi:murein DD-endopeptidase MepM/ murein hydrolase activator NlpD